jgi:23S rRNA (cytosine1962-C5)-methyltransferase
MKFTVDVRCDRGREPSANRRVAQAQTAYFTSERISRKGDDFWLKSDDSMTIMGASSDDYELLDFGNGRKLERFGGIVLDKPCAAAEGEPELTPADWRSATARYERTAGDQGVWLPANVFPMDWQVTFTIGSSRNLTFQLQGSPFGHVGVFPEQLACWEWIAPQVAKWQAMGPRPLRVLNLFAYTGGSTLAAAATGAEVVHIDAARNIVERARRNAALSGLSDRPIRWITEDALRFCRRELKRGNRYDAVILDPPSYGHGPKGEPWKIGEHLLPLAKTCGELTAQHRAFVLATCHTPGIGPAELAAYLAEGFFGDCSELTEAGELFVQTRDGRRLPSGVFARWPG